MHTFKDNEGRTWNVEINVAALKRVRSLAGTDLMQVVEGTGALIERLIRDPVLLCDVVYALCKPQADERSVSDEQFGRSMAGDVIEAATTAVLEELVSFCPSPRDRENLGRVLKATAKVMDKARDLVSKRIDTLVGTGETIDLAALAAQLPATPGTPSTDAPASSASTPGP